jgi:plasmid segregation protein ParM
MPIDLAIGLPPAHFGAQNKAFVRYFKRKEPIYFSYRDKLYSILIRNVQCYPQAFAAAAMMLGELATVPRALILDVGGFTADYLLLKNGRADLSTCDSLENGVILLYNRIRSKASSDLDILLEETDVDAILLQGQGSSYGEEVAALVEYQAQEFVNDMLGALRERQLDLRTGRVIFVGGGACLLRRQIETSGKVAHPVFVEDVNANAKGFEYLYRCTVTGA